MSSVPVACSGGYVSPLVASAHLEFAVLCLVEVEEVVPLEQLVGEFGERKAVARLAVKAFLYAFFCHHVVYGDVFADVACKVEELEVFHPVVVVHEFGAVRGVAFKVEEMCELFFYAAYVVCKRFLVEQVAFLAFSRGVANHSRSSSHEGYGFVAGALQVAQHHDAAQVAYME